MTVEAPPPDNELERLKALEQSQLLDSAQEEIFDSVTRIAHNTLNVPIALISLVDKDRQWFKSSCGLSATETPRGIAFCSHTILEPSKVFVVKNALEDERFHKNPLVTGEPNIRFYAGAPLVVQETLALGTLCLIDTVPHEEFTQKEKAILLDLASIAAHIIELRLKENLSVGE